MNHPNEHISMAIFCDFENVALGVRDTKYQKFDIRPVLERLLLKGSIVVKKAYCDWERYKEFKAPMHEANFELIEIPHVRQSGKNSADIRLVVDALDFCYTKSHVNTFVIISGDSDFSPLVSKLRENNKTVIGVGVKQSTSDLLVANCDEFIFYDDLARESQRSADARRGGRGSSNPGQRRSPEEVEARRTQAVDMVVETFEALMAERSDSGKIWASVVKEALKRRRPDFNESYYGFRAFGNVLEEAQARGYLEVGRAENSSTYVYRSAADEADAAPRSAPALPVSQHAQSAPVAPSAQSPRAPRTARTPRTRGVRGGRPQQAAEPVVALEETALVETVVAQESIPAEPELAPTPAPSAPAKRGRTRTRRPAKAAAEAPDTATAPVAAIVPSTPEPSPAAAPVAAATRVADDAASPSDIQDEHDASKKPARKTTRNTTTRPRRPRKTATTTS